ncbi:uncharacterized protein F5147DRAFT_683583 [Suillus discolor]|uniref:Uncharacterized protein n=1 Tax=Suillus discolor TaxID=1912936 RepID=A0A9P7FCY3_9AGAM|nr:uncharacterized protein F5147DRAFT_683583 [Suillus discolor]KAG2112588.1 hypothetical protein F5147DRAFT_683583 [Suillus discolor]
MPACAFCPSHFLFVLDFIFTEELSCKKEDDCRLLTTSQYLCFGHWTITGDSIITGTITYHYEGITTEMAIATLSHPEIDITQAGCWTRFLLWIGWVTFQHSDGQQ